MGKLSDTAAPDLVLWLLVVTGLFTVACCIQRMAQARRGRRERASQAAHLMTRELTEDGIPDVREFPSEITEGPQDADADFETRRSVIGAHDVRVTLILEEGERVVHTHWIFDSKDFCATSRTLRARSVQLLGIAPGEQPGRLDDQGMASYNRPCPARKCLRNS
jgi:hypothetical protein